MSGDKYLVFRMKWALSIPLNLTWRRRLTSLLSHEQVTNDFCCLSMGRNWSVSGAVPSAARVAGHAGSSVAPVQV